MIKLTPHQDYSQLGSSTNPDFVMRVNDALLERQIAEEATIQAKRALGKPLAEPYKGYSDAETSLTQRITKATFQPENDTAYRTQLRLQNHLKEVARNLAEDAKRNRQYAKDLKQALQAY